MAAVTLAGWSIRSRTSTSEVIHFLFKFFHLVSYHRPIPINLIQGLRISLQPGLRPQPPKQGLLPYIFDNINTSYS